MTMAGEIQCFDGDGEPPPSERLVRVPCSSLMVKDDFNAPGDDKGYVEFRLDFANQNQCDARLHDLHDVRHDKCCFLLSCSRTSILLVDAYFVGYRHPEPWSIVAKFTKPKQVCRTDVR